jgi:hypothetical protein
LKRRDLPALRKFQLLTLGLVVVYLLVLSQDRKEFWPFSAFPMFSKAGATWRRAVLRQVPPTELANAPCSTDFRGLPGQGRSPRQHRLNPSDLSAWLAKSTWPLTAKARRDLARSFKKVGRRTLLLYEAQGSFAGGETRTRFLLRARVDASGVESAMCPANGASSRPQKWRGRHE